MKKKEQKIAIKFHHRDQGSHGYSTYDNVVYKRLELAKSKRGFLHLERKGNTWILLDGLGRDSDLIEQLTFVREEDKATVIVCDDARLEISTHTELHLPSHQFWHLDELPDRKWRLAYTTGHDIWNKRLTLIEFLESGTLEELGKVMGE
jgi:hypothetical protein